MAEVLLDFFVQQSFSNGRSDGSNDFCGGSWFLKVLKWWYTYFWIRIWCVSNNPSRSL